MIDLHDRESKALIGSITEAELKFLQDALEETSIDDNDYFIDQGTIDLLAEDGGATDHLLALLKQAVGSGDGVEIRWTQR
ncbi:MAG: galactosyldiacylglycerol synthase [Gemmatimonadales bacterium]